MNVIGYDPYMTVEAAWSVSRAVKRAASEDALIAEADFLTLHVPLNDETRGKVNADYIAKMKEGATLLNFSRGEIVDDEAILAALESGHIRAYVTDFPNQKLLGKKGVIAIPHLGASTPESEENCARMASEQIAAFLTVGAVRNSVNLPQCDLAPPTAFRVTVIHKNIPAMLSRITDAMGTAGINISDMVNRSRGDIAYTVLDIESAPPADTVEKLEAVDGIIRVRVI
jgi:D-3-phosphoglycerate dehydrogenase